MSGIASRVLGLFAIFVCLVAPASAAEPLITTIDRLITTHAVGAKQTISPPASDSEFLRRVYLDFTGRIPTLTEAKTFLNNPSATKRNQLIDSLIDGPEFGPHMANVMHIALMERLGDNALWLEYLSQSFTQNKPWDKMVRDMLWSNPADQSTQGAAFFLSKRLENYGQNPVDYSGLTRDVGRLFLGKNLGCAECHDHLFIEDYKQAHFQGLHTFLKNSYLVNANPPTVGEKPTTAKTAFASVFTKKEKLTAPALPGGEMVEIPAFKKGDEYLVAPDKKAKTPGQLKFSPLKTLSEMLPTASNREFVQTSANRFWFILMGRGLIHPLDLSHSRNPASHPQVLDAITDAFADHQFDVKWLLKQLARTQAYQRSSALPAGVTDADAKLFTTALERRLSAEQLAASVLTAIGEKPSAALTKKFVKAYANQAREPEDEFTPSLQGALFVLHDNSVLKLLEPKSGNLVGRVSALTDHQKIAEELYLAILTRQPTAEETQMVSTILSKHSQDRVTAVKNIAWALLASMEFMVNH
ncbi:MAG: DUF1549 and DUF1553 domain-containing protein [Bacteroidales bacterium]|nr:DUF1549 and DUF1553 domain-containing protein [Bacteroidales bacterium]